MLQLGPVLCTCWCCSQWPKIVSWTKPKANTTLHRYKIPCIQIPPQTLCPPMRLAQLRRQSLCATRCHRWIACHATSKAIMGRARQVRILPRNIMGTLPLPWSLDWRHQGDPRRSNSFLQEQAPHTAYRHHIRCHPVSLRRPMRNIKGRTTRASTNQERH